MRKYTNDEVNNVLYDNMDALLVVSSKDDTYRAIKRSEEFEKFIEEEGSYQELIERLLFHMNDSNIKITDDYQVFLPKMGEFRHKYSRKINLLLDQVKHTLQMLVYPIEGNEGDYIILLCDLEQSEIERELETENKVKTIQETYLFSMYVDLNKDITSSVNVSEISDDSMHYDVKYSEWRMMIVHMIWPEDQSEFLKKTEPDYLKAHLKPGDTVSFNCQMKNLEGNYIWVKLIFGRSETTSKQDFRFVFMVQDIHENSIRLLSELKKFEKLASYDALTNVYNHGRIETELNNAIDEFEQNNRTISLMMLDIDFFKTVNDTYGHAVGDEILKDFVACIFDKVKEEDIVIGRWGGEEFVCVCYDKDVETLFAVAEDIRKTIETRTFDTIGTMTCSIGVAGLEKEDTVKKSFKRLDEALYAAKSDGRNCVKVYGRE